MEDHQQNFDDPDEAPGDGDAAGKPGTLWSKNKTVNEE